MIVAFHPEAEEEFQAYVRRYESKVTGLGARFIDEVERATGLIGSRPQMGREIEQWASATCAG